MPDGMGVLLFQGGDWAAALRGGAQCVPTAWLPRRMAPSALVCTLGHLSQRGKLWAAEGGGPYGYGRTGYTL